MAENLRAFIKKEFQSQIQRTLPRFHKEAAREIPPGWTLYASRPNSSLTFYIIFHIHQYQNDFTCELAWSTCNTVPPHGGRHPNDCPKNGGLSFRIGQLFEPVVSDHWWKVPGSILPQEMNLPATGHPMQLAKEIIIEQVENAVATIQQFAVPYFEKVAVDHGQVVKLK